MWVGFCSIVIFLTVPIAFTIQKFISENLGKDAFIYFVLLAVGLTFLSLLYFLIFKLKVRSLSNYIWLFVLAGLYSYFILKWLKAPAEAIHFLEYGLLGFFLFRALKYNIKDKSIYFTATLFCLLVGTFDEILQWITPRRIWSFRDVWLNTLSGGLFQIALWTVVKPKIISEKITVKSIRIFSSILTVCLIVLGLCASNTPKQVAFYAKLIPWLSSLQKEEPMSEFGYKYRDSEIGIFYSRLSLKNIRNIDKMKSEQNSQILNKYRNIKYEQFLREYNPISNPFLHELRAHVFRRDTYYKKAKTDTKIKDKRELYFITYKENLILEKYFSNTIKKSVYVWDDNKIKEAEQFINKNQPYESPVSANLFTSFSKKSMWIVIFVIISVLISINLIFYLKEKQRKKINL